MTPWHDREGAHTPNEFTAGVAEQELEQLDGLYAAGLTEDDVDDVFSFARHGRVEDIERLLDKGVGIFS